MPQNDIMGLLQLLFNGGRPPNMGGSDIRPIIGPHEPGLPNQNGPSQLPGGGGMLNGIHPLPVTSPIGAPGAITTSMGGEPRMTPPNDAGGGMMQPPAGAAGNAMLSPNMGILQQLFQNPLMMMLLSHMGSNLPFYAPNNGMQVGQGGALPGGPIAGPGVAPHAPAPAPAPAQQPPQMRMPIFGPRFGGGPRGMMDM